MVSSSEICIFVPQKNRNSTQNLPETANPHSREEKEKAHHGHAHHHLPRKFMVNTKWNAIIPPRTIPTHASVHPTTTNSDRDRD